MSTKAIFVGLRQLDIDLEDARPMFNELTGKTSIKAMNEVEKLKIVTHLRTKGFKPASARNKLQSKYAPKLQALWIGAWNLGIVENKTDQALLAFVKRQTGIDHTRFLRHAEDANKAIESLKAWMNREAFVDWHLRPDMQDYQRLSSYRIAMAQSYKLYKELAVFDQIKAFNKDVWEITGLSRAELNRERDWQPVMNHYGQKIRALK